MVPICSTRSASEGVLIARPQPRVTSQPTLETIVVMPHPLGSMDAFVLCHNHVDRLVVVLSLATRNWV